MMTAEEFNQREQEILDKASVPEALRGWLRHQAYEEGHSSGMGEVLNCLMSMLDGFPEAWKKYKEEVRKAVPEKNLNNAPCDLDNNEASAWSCGYETGRETVLGAL